MTPSYVKSELPPLRMIVGRGELRPADEYSQERLDSYRHNTVVDCLVTQNKNPKLLRKYWAILSRVVETCDTRWKSSRQANEALKFAFGLTEQVPLVDGQIRLYPGSLADLEEPEFEDFFAGSMALLTRLTGVDVLTLWKESADTGDPVPQDDTASADAAMEGDGGSNGLDPVRSPAAEPAVANPPDDPVDTEPDEPGPDDVDEHTMVNSLVSDVTALQSELIRKLVAMATDTRTSQDEKLEDLQLVLRPAWQDRLPDHGPFVAQCFSVAEKIVLGTLKPDSAKRFLMSLRTGK